MNWNQFERWRRNAKRLDGTATTQWELSQWVDVDDEQSAMENERREKKERREKFMRSIKRKRFLLVFLSRNASIVIGEARRDACVFIRMRRWSLLVCGERERDLVRQERGMSWCVHSPLIKRTIHWAPFFLSFFLENQIEFNQLTLIFVSSWFIDLRIFREFFVG